MRIMETRERYRDIFKVRRTRRTARWGFLSLVGRRSTTGWLVDQCATHMLLRCTELRPKRKIDIDNEDGMERQREGRR